MKILITFLLLFSTLALSAVNSNKIIMLKITNNFKANESDLELLKTSVEMNVTKLGYLLIDEKTQEEAIKEQKKQQNSDCYDEQCLVDTGRMLAARKLLMISMSKRKGSYFIKAKKIDIETGVIEKTDFTIIELNYNDEKAHEKISNIIKSLFSINSKRPINVEEAKIKTDYEIEIEINSEQKDIIFFNDYTKKEISKTTPFKVKTSRNNRTLILACKEGYKPLKTILNINKKNINIKLEKRKVYNLTIESNENSNIRYQEKNNPCGNKINGVGSKNMNLLEGDYYLTFSQKKYLENYKDITLNEDKKITIHLEKHLNYDIGIDITNEYTYIKDVISKRNFFHSGFIINFNKQIDNREEFSIFSIGLLGDFFSNKEKSIILRFGIVPTYTKLGWFFYQMSFFGFGGEMDIQFYDEHIILTPLTLKLGLSIPITDYFDIKIYGNASWSTEILEDAISENDGYLLTGGVILELKY